MGPQKVKVNSPSNFLRKSECSKPEKKPFSYPGPKKEPLPDQKQLKYKPYNSSKDFISKNAIEVIKASPNRPVPNYVDTPSGNTAPLEPSGLVPRYAKKANYGKVPEYVKNRREEVAAAQEQYDEFIRTREAQNEIRSLSDEERTKIIEGLKQNWEELHHRYQGLSVVTDTAPKKYRKERMEAEMKQLERDIEMVEKHRHIFIEN